MAAEIKVAVIQLYAISGSPEENYAKAESEIRQAARKGCNLAVLPEYHLSSWCPEDPRFAKIARRYKDYIAKYQALAKELQICIVPGTIVASDLDHNSDQEDELVNIAVFIDNNGTVLQKYEKRNLWHPERAHLSPGVEHHQAFETPFGKVGLLVCWDLAFNEAFRDLIAQDAKLVIIPAYWLKTDGEVDGKRHNPMSESVFLDATLISRAFENTCAVIFCNIGGPTEEYLGISQVTLPLMGSIARLPGAREQTLITKIDMKIVEAAEATYKIRADLAKDDWHYDYRRVPAPSSS